MHPFIEDYTYKAVRSEEEGDYMATCVEFPTLSCVAPSEAQALSTLKRIIARCVDEMVARCETLPEPRSPKYDKTGWGIG